MRYILASLLAVSLYAKDTCYTVQLLSAKNSQKNMQALKQTSYPDECLLMEIGNSLTVRCGCYNKLQDAKVNLKSYESSYPKLSVTSTYKYRFDKRQEPIDTPVSTEMVKEEFISDDTKEKNLVVVEEAVIVENPHEQVVLKQIPLATTETSKKTKKKKKKKKSKNKLVKKRDAKYEYEYFLSKLRSRDGIGKYDYRYRFGAQFSYDLGFVSEEDALKGHLHYVENDWRRVRVFHEGSFFDESLFYQLEYSLTGNNQYKDVYLGYTDKIDLLNTRYRIKLGNIKIPFSLERYTTSKNITFMERALNDAFSVSRRMGGELHLYTKLKKSRINIFVSSFSNSIDQRIDGDVNQPGYSARAVYGYRFNKKHIVSVGAGYIFQDMKGEDVRFSQSSESQHIQDNYVSVRISDVDTMIKNNIEALYIYDKYSLQAEYTKVQTDSLEEDYAFDAYYIQGSYFLTGKRRNYNIKEAKFSRLRPNKDGAIELAFRYSHIDLNDKDEIGGMQTDYNYGVNWYYSDELKFNLNYIVAEPKGTDDYDGRLQVLQGRVLFSF